MEVLDHRISRFSYRIRIGLFALLAVIALATLFALLLDKGTVWFGVDAINLGVATGDGDMFGDGVAQSDDRGTPGGLGVVVESAGLALFLISALYYGLLIFQLERLFAAYQHGEIFSQQNARRIRNLGLLFCAAAAIVLLESLLDLYLIQGLMADSDLDGSEDGWELVREIRLPIPFLLGGAAIVLIARVMEKAAELQEEMDHLI